jgi:replicative DNA helicase
LGIIPFSKAKANTLRSIYKSAIDLNLAYGNLPATVDALRVLFIHFRDAKFIEKLVSDGRITSATTAPDVRHLAHELGLLAKKVKVPVTRESPKSRRVETVLKLVQRLGLTINDLKQGDK